MLQSDTTTVTIVVREAVKQADQRINLTSRCYVTVSQSIYRGSSLHAPESVSRGHNLLPPFPCTLDFFCCSGRTPNVKHTRKCHTEWLHTRTQFAICRTFSLGMSRAQRTLSSLSRSSVNNSCLVSIVSRKHVSRNTRRH